MKKGIVGVLGLTVTLALLMLAASCGSPSASPSIWTDKPDYAPEETVTISGAGFTPGPVALTVTRPDGEIERIADVSADNSGSFTASYLLDGILGTYIVDATDSAGQTAQTTFTDGSTGIYAGPQVGMLTYGVPGSVNYSITVTGSGGGHTRLFTVSLPSGTTASFDPDYLESPWPAYSTLMISYDGTTPAGNYTFCLGESPSGDPPAHHQTDPCPSLVVGCTDTDGDGVCDEDDNCPNDPNKTEPGVCGCGVADTDTDGDGVADCNDGCPADPNKTAPGVCGCGVADTDTDGDGVADCIDGCPNDPNKTAPGVCGCGTPDTDTDSDGTADCNDQCPNDSNKTVPGQCGCGIADTDSDGDGTADCNDLCPSDPSKIDPGQCGCGTPDTDTDSDGTADCNDGCPADPNKTAPGICGCGVADIDSDSDGTPDCDDCAPTDPDIYPGAPELPDGKDNDCDGSIDEGIGATGPTEFWILVIQSTEGGRVTEPTGGGNFPYGAGDFLAYYPDTVVDLVAVPDAGYRFVGWTGGPHVVADVSAATTTIIMNRDSLITANFAEIPETPQIQQYDLTTSSSAGGSVDIPGEGTFTYDADTVLDLVAEADPGCRFVNWTGDVTAIENVNGASTTITMNDDYSVVANFAEIPPPPPPIVTLTTSSSAGGSVATPGEATFPYDEGTVVDLQAEPEEGYRFVIWIGDVDEIADVTAASTTITMNGDYSITATFKFGTGCFIATAAYGTPMAEEIQILRDFRDGYLLTNAVGEALVDVYYRGSPPIAEFITEHPSLKPIVRVGLVPAVAMSALAVNTSPTGKLAIVGLLVLFSVALVVRARKRRGKSPQYL